MKKHLEGLTGKTMTEGEMRVKLDAAGKADAASKPKNASLQRQMTLQRRHAPQVQMPRLHRRKLLAEMSRMYRTEICKK